MGLYNPNGFFFFSFSKGKLDNRRFGNQQGAVGGRVEAGSWAPSVVAEVALAGSTVGWLLGK